MSSQAREKSAIEKLKILNLKGYPDQLHCPTLYEFIAVIFCMHMGLLKKVHLGIGHVNVCSPLITISWSNPAPELKFLAWGFWPGYTLKSMWLNPCLLFQYPSRESIEWKQKEVSVLTVSACSCTALVTTRYQHSGMEQRRWFLSWSIYSFYVYSVSSSCQLSPQAVSEQWWKSLWVGVKQPSMRPKPKSLFNFALLSSSE